MQDKKTFNAIVAVIVCSLIIVTAVVSYSFLNVSTPSNNDNRTDISASTESNLELVYTDCAESNQEDCANISKDLGLGESVTKTFQIKNDTKVNSQYTIYFKELQSTFKNDELVYKIENLDSGDVLVDTTSVPYKRIPEINIPIKENIRIENGTIHNYKMTVTFLKKDYNQNENKDAMYSMKLSIVPKENPNFALAATTDEGLYSMIDDSGNKSYYYRGVVENNYVKFGVDVQGNDMYWRIIRFNGDGSMRMQYDGKANGHSDTDFTYTRGFLLTSAWNTNKDDAKYVGWMFGGNQGEASTDRDQAQKNETDSDIKVKVDTWYKNTLLDNYHDYIADEIFCNDRSTPGKDATGWSGDTGLGYEKNQTGYGMSVRLGVWNENSDTPRFTCQQENDKFTVSAASGGNGKSKYPVGLITADEVMAAGSGKFGITNQSYYLYKGIFYWSLSPKYFDGSSANVFGEFGGLKYTMTHSSQSNAVLPVINIKPEYVEKMIGDGTAGNPYRLEI